MFRPADKVKIRLAISLQRIDPADIPVSTRLNRVITNTPSSVSSTSQTRQKRTVAQAGFESASTDRNSFATQEQEEEEVVEEEVVDELYCHLVAKVVGIQYYKGIFPHLLPKPYLNVRVILGLVGPGEEVRLLREPNNPYDR